MEKRINSKLVEFAVVGILAIVSVNLFISVYGELEYRKEKIKELETLNNALIEHLEMPGEEYL